MFFAAAGLLTAEEAQEAQETPSPEYEELQLVLEKLSADNARLKEDLQQREAVIRSLTENLAIARTESELFQKRWGEAQLRAQTLGVNFADPEATQIQRQLIEGMRALYVAETERQRLIEQLGRLVSAVEGNGDVAAETARTRQLLAQAERPAGGEQSAAGAGERRPEPTLDTARVLEVNPQLRLVVLNVGLLHGARVGMPFLVLRGDRVVAELKVVEVRKSICGALIEKVERGVTLANGDTARVTKS